MVCIYCGGETKVTNSRRQKRNNQVWRRRQCLACQSVFTTHESVELESALSVNKGGRLRPFLPDLLLQDLMLSLRDRQDAYTASREVMGTIVRTLLSLPQKPVLRLRIYLRRRRLCLRGSINGPTSVIWPTTRPCSNYLSILLTLARSDLVAFSVMTKPK
jgi:hypothetical protein